MGVIIDRMRTPVLATAAVLALLSACGGGSSGPKSGDPSAPTVIARAASGLKAGLLTFGGAYTAIPFVRHDAVGSGWLTDGQFLDGLALSGVLPAPLIIFATFVGFVVGGLPGAVAITLGIFLPAFSFALVLGDRLEALVDWTPLHRALEGVAAGVVGIITVTALQLGGAVAGRTPSLAVGSLIFLAALLVVVRWQSRAAVPLVVVASGVAGYLLLGAGLR